jgi:hypothetical protein
MALLPYSKDQTMTTKRILSATVICLAMASALGAGEVAGVKLPDTSTVEGRTLRLNGMGLRKKLVFKVYVAGLYLENQSKDASTIISSDQVKSIQLHILRSISGSELTQAIAEAFWKNAKQNRSSLEPRLQKLNTMLPSVISGDVIVLSYVPGRGTMVTAKGQQKGIIEGKDFADALFAVWLGGEPVQADLKKLLLGG